jgi:nitrate reductase gamma subunit
MFAAAYVLRPACRPHPVHRHANKETVMRELVTYIVFGWYPYLCLTVFLLGSWVRFDREQYTWRSGSSQLLRRRQLAWGSNLFHVGILIIFFGHFAGLLTPIWVFDMLGISHTFKQWMAISVGGIAGVFCFIGITLLVHRRLFDARIRTTSSFGDIAILLMLYAQLTLGLLTIGVSLDHLDGHVMMTFMAWAQGILTLQPGVSALIADVHPIFKLHLLLGMTIFLVFPFTRLVHVWSAPIWYLGRRGYQVVRTRGTRQIAVRTRQPRVAVSAEWPR